MTDRVTFDKEPFEQLPTALILDGSLSSNAKVVYGVLRHFAGLPLGAIPGRKTLGEALGRGLNAVDRATKELFEAGWILVLPRETDHSGYASNHWHLMWDPIRSGDDVRARRWMEELRGMDLPAGWRYVPDAATWWTPGPENGATPPGPENGATPSPENAAPLAPKTGPESDLPESDRTPDGVNGRPASGRGGQMTLDGSTTAADLDRMDARPDDPQLREHWVRIKAHKGAETWHAEMKRRDVPVPQRGKGRQSPTMALASCLRPLLAAGYTPREVWDALDSIGVPNPAAQQLERELVRRRRTAGLSAAANVAWDTDDGYTPPDADRDFGAAG